MQSEADAWKVVLDALTGLYATGSTCANKSGQGYATSYDAFGNVSSRTYNTTTATLSYDDQDQFVEWNAGASSQEWYLYDGTGQRVLRRSINNTGTTLTVYAFGLEEHVYSGTGSNQGNTYYYMLVGQLLGKSDGQSSTFYQTDLLGSVVADWSTTAGSAALLGNEVYGPYGKERYNQGTHGTSIGFTGQYGDWVSGLDYYNARYYDPKAGVFLSADTVQGNVQGVNPYSYVGGNPETYTDPSGQRAVSAGDGSSDGASTFVPTSYNPPSSSPFQFTPSNPCWDVGCRYGAYLQISTTEVVWHRTSIDSTGGVVCSLVCMALQYQSNLTTYTIYRTDKALPVQGCTLSLVSCEGEKGRNEEPSQGERPAVDMAADEGAKPVEDKPLFPNQYPEKLPSELELGNKLGVTPKKVGDPGFQEMIQNGQVKWAVTEDGGLAFIPKYVDGVEIPHTLITGGDPVYAAGEAEIINTGNGYMATSFNMWSGHYQTDEASSVLGIDAFIEAKITFRRLPGLRW